MKIKFINVGRTKKTWEIETEEVNYDLMYREVKKHLLSDNIDFIPDDEEIESGAIVVGGLREVGKYKIVMNEGLTVEEFTDENGIKQFEIYDDGELVAYSTDKNIQIKEEYINEEMIKIISKLARSRI